MPPASDTFHNSDEEQLRRASSGAGLTLGLVLVGCMVPLALGLVLPSDPDAAGGLGVRSLMLLIGGVPLALGLVYLPVAVLLRRAGAQKLARFRAQRASAVPGHVRLVRVEQLYAGEVEVQVRLQLEVAVAGKAPYPLTLTQWVQPAFLARLRPDERLPVRVARDDAQVLFLDWSGTVAEPGSPTPREAR